MNSLYLNLDEFSNCVFFLKLISNELKKFWNFIFICGPIFLFSSYFLTLKGELFLYGVADCPGIHTDDGCFFYQIDKSGKDFIFIWLGLGRWWWWPFFIVVTNHSEPKSSSDAEWFTLTVRYHSLTFYFSKKINHPLTYTQTIDPNIYNNILWHPLETTFVKAQANAKIWHFLTFC